MLRPTKTGAKLCPGFVSSVLIDRASHFTPHLRQLLAPPPPAARRAGGCPLTPGARGHRHSRVVARRRAVREGRRWRHGSTRRGWWRRPSRGQLVRPPAPSTGRRASGKRPAPCRRHGSDGCPSHATGEDQHARPNARRDPPAPAHCGCGDGRWNDGWAGTGTGVGRGDRDGQRDRDRRRCRSWLGWRRE